MTDFYDVERTITSLGTGEALITVLSPDGVPTPLAATRLLPPDSLMAPISEEAFAARVAESPLVTTYGTPVDPESAHELITARLQAAPRGGCERRRCAEPVPPTTNTGLNAMTPPPSSGKRCSARRASCARHRRPPTASAGSRPRSRHAVETRAADRQMQTAIRTGGELLTSRTGQSVLRGIFGTIFGGGKSR